MDNLIFISVFNFGAIEIATNHLKSLQNQNIDNYMAYVTDQESFDQLHANGYHVTLFQPASFFLFKEKEYFGTNNFNDFSYVRYQILLTLLREGKTVWYMDVDTVVLSDVQNDYIQNPNKFDIIMQDDINMACSGCMLCFPTPVTIKIIEDTYLQRNNQQNDQLLLNQIMPPYIEQGLCKIAFFQHHLFPNGLLYFHKLHSHPHYLDLQKKFRKYRDQEHGTVSFVHANWMVGIDKKIAAFRQYRLWFL